MAKIGIIGGTALFYSKLFRDFKKKKIKTKYGEVEYLKKNNVFFIQRHSSKKLPPHMINHHANIAALWQLGIKNIIGVASCGSLKLKIKPLSIVIPDDYMNFDIKTFFNKRAVFTMPGLSEQLRKRIINAAKKLKIKTINKGIYLQTKGPRLETKAEINLMKNYADIIGMTIANEAELAKELKLNYASICGVDNYANGITKKPLSNKEIEKGKQKSIKYIEKILKQLMG